eukprot:Hpha_TRINITY_DN7128_c0_g1::TRINITY_DN7128_c0_g1_i2::g.29797::m.29797
MLALPLRAATSMPHIMLSATAPAGTAAGTLPGDAMTQARQQPAAVNRAGCHRGTPHSTPTEAEDNNAAPQCLAASPTTANPHNPAPIAPATGRLSASVVFHPFTHRPLVHPVGDQ